MLGRTNWKLPVCSCTAACGWFGRSVCMLLSRHRSSACLATFGNSSEISRPLCAGWRELPGRFQQLAIALAAGLGRRFAVVALQRRLVVERIDVRRAALHEHEDHALGPRRKCGFLAASGCCFGGRGVGRLAEQAGEGQVAEAAGSGFEHFAAGEDGRT